MGTCAIEWKEDLSTALAVVAGGWCTEDEHAIYLGAVAFVARIRQDAYARMLPKCPTCGAHTEKVFP